MLRIFQLCVPYEHDISMTEAPNLTRPEPFEIRHPKIYVHIKFKENEAPKGLQLAMQKLICIRNREKRRAKSEKKN